MKLDHVPTLSEKEQLLVSALNLMAANIRKAKSLSFPAATNVVNRGHNKEWSYICHFIVLLLGAVVLNSKLFIDYNITSNVYLDCKINVQDCRHDIILYTKDGTEIASGEVNPMNAAQESVEEDKARIAESCKKQLHKRLYKARNKKELYTYRLLIYNDQFILTISHLTERGEYQHYTAYECALASKPDKYAFMAETLEILIHFLNMAEDTVPEADEEMSNDLIWSKYVENIKPIEKGTEQQDPLDFILFDGIQNLQTSRIIVKRFLFL